MIVVKERMSTSPFRGMLLKKEKSNYINPLLFMLCQVLFASLTARSEAGASSQLTAFASAWQAR